VFDILFINHKIQNCGVYQYGKRTANILANSQKFNLDYVEVDSQEELLNLINEKEPEICLFNYHQTTMNWLDLESITHKKVAIHHESSKGNFRHIISVDPTTIENEFLFKVVRPLFNHQYQNTSQQKSEKPIIGSFGFGFEHKGFDKICKLVNEQFDIAEIRLHITFNHYGNNSDFLDLTKQKCKNEITKEGIELKITSHFISDEELSAFLSQNDINIFAYDSLVGRGPASVLDFAIGARKPIGLTRSYMFKHLEPYFQFFDLEEKSIREIINKSEFAINQLNNNWSNDNLVANYEQIFKKLSKG